MTFVLRLCKTKDSYLLDFTHGLRIIEKALENFYTWFKVGFVFGIVI